MSNSGLVELAVYDLSHGMAKQFLGNFLGVEVEAIYHTGVRVYGYEYFFSDGIQKMRPEEVASRFGMNPFEVTPMGETELPEELIDSFVEENRSRFSSETYDLLNHNCNNFSEELVNFLLGCSIPEKILNLPQMLINTPQGQMVAPLLEQMGATRAIPLSTNTQPVTTQITPSTNGMDLSCLSPWSQYPVTNVIMHLQQIATCIQTEEERSIVKLCYLLYEKNKAEKPCFYALQQCIQYIDHYIDNASMQPLLYDIFYLLAYNIPHIVAHIDEVKALGQSLFTQLVTSIATSLLTLPPSTSLYLVFCFCLTVLTSTPYHSELCTNPIFPTLLQTIISSLPRDVPSAYAMSILLLANTTSIFPPRRSEEDPSEEVLLLLNVLSEGICEEENATLLKMRIGGLYQLVKNGGLVEKITLQSQGVCSDSSIRVAECRDMWKQLVDLCEHCNVC